MRLVTQPHTQPLGHHKKPGGCTGSGHHLGSR